MSQPQPDRSDRTPSVLSLLENSLLFPFEKSRLWCGRSTEALEFTLCLRRRHRSTKIRFWMVDRQRYKGRTDMSWDVWLSRVSGDESCEGADLVCGRMSWDPQISCQRELGIPTSAANSECACQLGWQGLRGVFRSFQYSQRVLPLQQTESLARSEASPPPLHWSLRDSSVFENWNRRSIFARNIPIHSRSGEKTRAWTSRARRETCVMDQCAAYLRCAQSSRERTLRRLKASQC